MPDRIVYPLNRFLISLYGCESGLDVQTTVGGKSGLVGTDSDNKLRSNLGFTLPNSPQQTLILAVV